MGQDKQTQFKIEDNGVYDWLPFLQYQRRLFLLFKSQEITKIESDWLVTKKTILIKMIESEN